MLHNLGMKQGGYKNRLYASHKKVTLLRLDVKKMYKAKNRQQEKKISVQWKLRT
jgi:hypothetical protein